MIKGLFIGVLVIAFGSNSCQTSVKSTKESDSTKFLYSYQKDGKEITGEVKDSLVIKELNKMLKEGPNYVKQKKEVRDENGNLLLEYATDLEKSEWGLIYTKYTYDSSGRLTSIQNFGQGEQLVNVYFDISATEYSYDQRGNEIEQRFYDKNKNPTLHGELGYYLAKSVYKNDKIKEIRLFDEKLRPKKKLAVIKYYYDERDSLTDVVDYDENGNEVNRERK